MKLLHAFLIVAVSVAAETHAKDLTLDDLFPTDRVVDVKITLPKADWDKIRVQSRSFQQALPPSRRVKPPKAPYTWVEAKVTIDGVVFPRIGLRKKGFIGSQSTTRPSLKVKLNFVDKQKNIQGLKTLTLNNNVQDKTLMSQYMGYRQFNLIGSPAPRCSFAKVTVNGVNMGIYSHVETIRKPLLQRGFGTTKGTLYEGTVTDFFTGWEKSFERKCGKRKKGLKRIKRLTAALALPGETELMQSDSSGRAIVPSNGAADSQWYAPDFDDSAWTKGSSGAGFDTTQDYKKLISQSFNLEKQLRNKSTSLYLRFDFTIKDAATVRNLQQLILRAKYDDGFVAYLNGQRVLSVNAPKKLTWKSRATRAQDDRAAQRFEKFDISTHTDLLRQGKNTLAIHCLNVSSTSTDMLFLGDLWASKSEPSEVIGKYVDLDAFYRFWAMEGLLGFWDGYSGNRNNFFVYLHPKTKKFHFIPWGGDCMFQKHSPLRFGRQGPVSVKTAGRIAYKLYTTKKGRERYRATMKSLLDKHWNEDQLEAEMARIHKMIKPHLCLSQRFFTNYKSMSSFVKARRKDIQNEISDGMPIWTERPKAPPVIGRGGIFGRRRRGD